MEVHELKEVIDGKFSDLNKLLDTKFTHIDQCVLKLETKAACIEKKVSSHEKTLNYGKGVAAILAFFVGLIFKIK